jgi:hypothetical protein
MSGGSKDTESPFCRADGRVCCRTAPVPHAIPWKTGRRSPAPHQPVAAVPGGAPHQVMIGQGIEGHGHMSDRHPGHIGAQQHHLLCPLAQGVCNGHLHAQTQVAVRLGANSIRVLPSQRRTWSTVPPAYTNVSGARWAPEQGCHGPFGPLPLDFGCAQGAQHGYQTGFGPPRHRIAAEQDQPAFDAVCADMAVLPFSSHGCGCSITIKRASTFGRHAGLDLDNGFFYQWG